MVSGSVLEIGFIVLLCVSMRSNYVEMLPSSFLQDEQQQAEQQSEAISENFFDEVRQLLEQKISSEAAVMADLETTTTESAPIVNADEHFVDVTVSPTADRRFKDNSPAIKPPRPTQVSKYQQIAFGQLPWHFSIEFFFSIFHHRSLIGQNWTCDWVK